MRLLILSVLLFIPSVAHAEWLEASSDHFVVYADDSERDVRRFSDQLERYHAAMAFLTGKQLSAPSPSNRVTVYVVRNDREVRKLHDGDDKYVAGFYLPRAGGSLAIVPRVQAGNGEVEFSMVILLHEYAHHFMYSTSTFPVPRWLSEGTAEFFASASFERDGTVWVGRPAQHRAAEIYFADDVKAEELLDPDSYDNEAGKHFDAYYGKAWLLYHFLTFDEERKGQLTRYIKGLIEGKSSRESALAAFGEFKQLDKDLKAYLRRRRTLALRLGPERIKTGAVAVRRLTAGEEAMMPVRIQSKVGVTEDEAEELAIEARDIAARFPGDAATLASLAEAEFDSGNPEAAIKAADAALAIDPTQVNAWVQKGYAMFELAADTDDPVKAFGKARDPFLKLNKLEHDHPIPLIYFFRSFAEMGREPTQNAKDGLELASQLAPFDLGLRMNAAQMMMRDGRYKAARLNLVPIAHNPHGGGLAETARALLASIEGEPDRPSLLDD